MKASSLYLLLATALALPSKRDDSMSMPSTDVGTDSGMDTEMDPSPMSMEHHHGRPILENPHLEPQQRKYWEQYDTTTFFNSEEGSKFNLYAHAVLSVTAFALLAPLNMLLSTDSTTQWLYIPLQTAQTILAIGSYFFLGVYAVDAPKLYEGNAYSGFTIAMLVFSVTHWTALIIKSIASYLSVDSYYHGYVRPSVDKGDGATYSLQEDPEAFALDDVSRENSIGSGDYSGGSDTEISSLDMSQGGGSGKAGYVSQHAPPPYIVRKLAGSKLFSRVNSFVGGFANVIFTLLNYPLFALGWGYMMTGLATAFLMGKDFRIFALLAHFIKGWVFFALGFIELARFFGAGVSRGWAWNEVLIRPSKTQATGIRRLINKFWPQYPTIEFVQSFLIFFYGSTNVFLEHLGNKDGVWSHKDLQHASIAFMFFGGGLCGMILESATVTKLVGYAFGFKNDSLSSNARIRRSFSINPMPAFIIFWTGALMSHHQQETELSTQIHVQWGYLFSLAAVLRLITLGLLLTRPRASCEEDAARPQRPFTEILVSFCLVCGGIIFMSSNRETVEGMIYRGLDQMFTMNVSVGVTVLLISYFVGCLAIKGWASSRYSQTPVHQI